MDLLRAARKGIGGNPGRVVGNNLLKVSVHMKRDSMDDEVIGAAKMLLRVVPLGKVVPKTFLLFKAHKKGNGLGFGQCASRGVTARPPGRLAGLGRFTVRLSNVSVRRTLRSRRAVR